jgi:hypothetical protein
VRRRTDPGRHSMLYTVMLAVALIALSGCMTSGLLGQMSPEQLEALSKIKDATTHCVVANTPYGRGVLIFASFDKGIYGTLTIDSECKTTISTSPAKALTK